MPTESQFSEGSLGRKAEDTLNKLNSMVQTSPYIVLPKDAEASGLKAELQATVTEARSIALQLRNEIKNTAPIESTRDGYIYDPATQQKISIADQLERRIPDFETALALPQIGQNAEIVDKSRESLNKVNDALKNLQEVVPKRDPIDLTDVDPATLKEAMLTANNSIDELEKELKSALPVEASQSLIHEARFSDLYEEKKGAIRTLQQQIKKIEDAQNGVVDTYNVNRRKYEAMIKEMPDSNINNPDAIARYAAQIREVTDPDRIKFSDEKMIKRLVEIENSDRDFETRYTTVEQFVEELDKPLRASVNASSAAANNKSRTGNGPDVASLYEQRLGVNGQAIHQQFDQYLSGVELSDTQKRNLQMFTLPIFTQSAATSNSNAVLPSIIERIESRRNAGMQLLPIQWQMHQSPAHSIKNAIIELFLELGLQQLQQYNNLSPGLVRNAAIFWLQESVEPKNVVFREGFDPFIMLQGLAAFPYIVSVLQSNVVPATNGVPNELQPIFMANYILSPDRKLDVSVRELATVIRHGDPSLLGSTQDINTLINTYRAVKDEIVKQGYSDLAPPQQDQAAIFLISAAKNQFSGLELKDVIYATLLLSDDINRKTFHTDAIADKLMEMAKERAAPSMPSRISNT